MKKYSTPELFFEKLETTDVLTASGIVYINENHPDAVLQSYDVEQMDLD